ncbi:MAG: DUF4129 domain-containing protein [Actinomycetota bacterium]
MTAASSHRSPLGWLAIPALLGFLVLVGLAISTESRADFENRTASAEQPRDAGQPDGAEPLDDLLEERAQGSDGTDPERSEPNPDQTGENSGQQSSDGQTDDADSSDEQTTGSDGESTTPVVIQLPNGDVVVQLGNGDTVTATPGSSAVPTDPSRTLSESDNGDFGAIRVTEDGMLEPIERPELPERDFGLTPAPGGGVSVTRPDGSVITLNPTDDGGLNTTEGAEARALPADQDAVLQPAEQFPAGHATAPTAQPLIVETESGPVRLELNRDGDLVANQPDPDSVVQVDPDDLVAIRVDENGNLEVVPLDQVGEDDTVLVPADGGVDLIRPDGSRVEFRIDGENDGVTATEVTPDGTEVELTPNPDGSVTLQDGTTVGPIDFAEDGGTFEQLLDQTADLPWPWVFGAIALLAVLSVATAVYLYRNQPENDFDFGQLAVTGVDVDEMEHFLAILSNDPDPDRAIRLAFYAAERGLGGLPARRQDETPFEWHNRVEQIRPELAEPLGPICDRFAMVRFAPGHATGADRDAVVARLRQLNLLADGAGGGRPNAMAGV